MGFSRFRIQVFFRTLLILITIVADAYLIVQLHYWATAVWLGAIALLQVFLLIRYVERTERDLSRFLEAITYHAYDTAFPDERSPSSQKLNDAFAKIIRDFRLVREQRELHYQYLQTVIQHIGTGLIAFDESGKIDLFNAAACRILQFDSLTQISQMEAVSEGISEALLSLKVSERKILRVHTSEGVADLSVYATKFRRHGGVLTLISLQNISRELEEKEMETWQSILRAMTHEIRNSMTPISSLASTTLDLLEQPQELCNNPEVINDARIAVRTIERRSKGLLNFVDAFRSLAHIPAPQIQVVCLEELFKHLQLLYHRQLAEKHIYCNSKIEPVHLAIQADPDLLEQVLINLFLNSIEAIDQRPNGMIEIHAHQDEYGRIHIEVSDNGPGLSQETHERAFIPFFSTKPTGSGIGLSLSRLILRLHGATIQLHSKPNIRTVSEVIFPREASVLT